MFVQVDRLGVVSLQARENFRAFELRASMERPALDLALRGIADLDEAGFAWVHEDWLLQQLVQQPPTSAWRTDFDAMLAYAQRQGWLRGLPVRSVRAHIVRD